VLPTDGVNVVKERLLGPESLTGQTLKEIKMSHAMQALTSAPAAG
jgi:hypothetical protein